VSGAPLRYRTGHAKTWRFCAFSGDERAQEHAFRPHDAQFFLIDFDPLGERAKVIAALAAAIDPHALAGYPGKRLERLWREMVGPARSIASSARSASRRACPRSHFDEERHTLALSRQRVAVTGQGPRVPLGLARRISPAPIVVNFVETWRANLAIKRKQRCNSASV